jgi:membrane-bound ClpP family serine protease
MIGMIGRTQTTLNPSGIVVIGEVSQPAKSKGELIPADTRVEVVRATSFGLVVRQVK